MIARRFVEGGEFAELVPLEDAGEGREVNEHTDPSVMSNVSSETRIQYSTRTHR